MRDGYKQGIVYTYMNFSDDNLKELQQKNPISYFLCSHRWIAILISLYCTVSF